MFFEKIHKIDKTFSKTNQEKKRIQINKILNEKWVFTTDTTERNIRDDYEQLYANKLDNLGKKDKFLETYNLPRLNHEEIENLIRVRFD